MPGPYSFEPMLSDSESLPNTCNSADDEIYQKKTKSIMSVL